MRCREPRCGREPTEELRRRWRLPLQPARRGIVWTPVVGRRGAEWLAQTCPVCATPPDGEEG